jgi:hypothetical protein
VDFVKVHHPELDADAVIPVSALTLHIARGWEQVSGPTSDLTRFADPEPGAPVIGGWEPAPPYVPVDAPVGEVLNEVGDDPAKAQSALAAEQDSTKPRRTLTTKLERVAEQTKENGNG